MKKLTTITTQYSKFSDNQVLTKGQLNEFLDYFEDQDHLSRIALSGVGIVCGFKLIFNTALKQISISKGYGVTTDGDLLTLTEPKPTAQGAPQEKGVQLINSNSKNYTHYRVFEDNKANYKSFIDASNTQIELLEIFSQSEIDMSSGVYSSLNTLENIEDKVVLLYLENYPKEGDLCTALDCDNQGIEQIARLRVLLISSDDAVSIASQDSILTEHSVEEYLKLPEIAVLRDIMNASNTKDYQSLKQRYFNVINNETVKILGENLDIILKKFNKDTISGKILSLLGMSSSAIPIDFQYRYDVLKDLVDTYSEIKNLLLHLNVLCCPSIGAFPKHLLLGRLNEVNQQYKSLRHNFYRSPIVGREDDDLQKVKSLLNRAQDLVTNYVKESKGSEIKITPSQAHGVLSNKTIPFYYQVNKDLLNHWSHNKYKNFTQTHNLSYHTENLSSSPFVKTPLLYNIDSFNFLRIEGIQGKSYIDALGQVMAIKETYGLSFDVKTLSVNATIKSIDINDYKCQFEDLSILLKAWRTEQNCILAEMSQFFSGFSTIEAGTNVVAIDKGYDLPVKLPVKETREIEVLNDKIKILELKLLKDSKKNDNPIIFGKDNLIIEAFKELKYNELYTQRDYGKNNIVREQLTIEDNTLGNLLANTFDKVGEDSANNILANFKEIAQKIMATKVWETEALLAKFIFEDIAGTLVYAYVLDNRIPTGILEIDNTTVSQYKLTIDELCKRIKGLQTKYQSTNIKEGSKQILGLLINQMSTVCCSGKKLEILLEEIEERKSAILNQIKLSEFVKKHPGLRHQAGVPIGGTFVMAYLTENATDQLTYETVRMELAFKSQPNLEDSKEPNEGFIKLWDERASTKFVFVDDRKKIVEIRNGLTKTDKYTTVGIGQTVEETVYNLAEFFNYVWSVAGFSKKCKATARKNVLVIELIDQPIKKNENYIEFSDSGIFGQSIRLTKDLEANRKIFFGENSTIAGSITSKNTIIADFSLPYICCSDCSPINFIVPRESISLSLPKDSICLEKGTEALTFTIAPKDGEVQALVNEGVNGGVIQNDKGEYQFDANVLDPSLYGKTIEFTVNGQDTTARIIVNKKATAQVSTTVRYNDDKKSAAVTYKVDAQSVLGTTKFTWDFGKGNLEDKTPDGNNEVIENYDLPVNSENTIKPNLIIFNGACESPIEIKPITFQDSVVELDIDGSLFCIDPSKKETLKISFNLKPDGAKLEVNGDLKGITIVDKVIVVDSTKFSTYGTPIGFAVDGNAMVTPTISIINKSDFASFDSSPKNPSVSQGTKSVKITFEITGLTNQQKKEYGFNWDFGFEATSDKPDTFHEFDISNQKVGNVLFPVTLVIKGGPCGAIEISKNITITINKTEVDTDKPENCIVTVENAIKSERKALNTNVDLQGDLIKAILLPTINLFDEVIKNMPEYLNGNKNNNLNNLFNELIQKTAKSLLVNTGNDIVIGVLSDYLRAQIKLFYNILHCQSERAIAKDVNSINPVIQVIQSILTDLRKNKVLFDRGRPKPTDSEGTLRAFLNGYINDPQAPETLKEGINILIKLILPIQ
ncbi:hypothetical protein [Mariniflexile sp. AS56]|uniref:hypothetical protein n=1 Tax=Mariniflexile sp. AS56 TaxID=3063957 RepID=UPI0026ECADC8|nr:hypothetical protein [Mariniflexile sp. AS56]MDO7174058.1 hypothetical protein [Mariniflexile sp. AS56]